MKQLFLGIGQYIAEGHGFGEKGSIKVSFISTLFFFCLGCSTGQWNPNKEQ
jgi:hypothetical protein